MAKNCVTEKTARRQEWIEEGLLELMQHRTFDEITVTELCSHLQLSRRSFYRYFQDLEDVLESALDHVFEGMVMTERAPEQKELERNYEFWLAHRSVLDALHRSGMLDRLYEHTYRFTKSRNIRQYLAPEDQTLWREASQFAISGSVALIIHWYQSGFRKTPSQMARLTHRMLFSPSLNPR